jgi:CheY-like chemotaxis protein
MERLRVLVVDDQEDVVELLCTVLHQLGHDCRGARDGAETLRAADEFQPDVILLDIGLPDMTGYDVCRALRARPRGSDVFVAALTGWSRNRDVEQAYDAGIDHHLTKPANRAKLQDVIMAAQERRRVRSARLSSSS